MTKELTPKVLSTYNIMWLKCSEKKCKTCNGSKCHKWVEFKEHKEALSEQRKEFEKERFTVLKDALRKQAKSIFSELESEDCVDTIYDFDYKTLKEKWLK